MAKRWRLMRIGRLKAGDELNYGRDTAPFFSSRDIRGPSSNLPVALLTSGLMPNDGRGHIRGNGWSVS